MSSDEEQHETVGQLKIPAKLLESTAGNFKDRSKRRLSLPISGNARDARKSSVGSSEGESGLGGVGERAHARRRSSCLSNESWSSYSSGKGIRKNESKSHNARMRDKEG